MYLISLLYFQRPEVHTNAASVIMFSTVKATGKLMAAEHPTMVPRLMALAQNRLNPSTQMFSIKVGMRFECSIDFTSVSMQKVNIFLKHEQAE